MRMTDATPPAPAPPAAGTSPLSLPAFRPLLAAFMAGGFASLALALFGGYVADQFNRRSIVLITRAALALCVAILTVVSLDGSATSVLTLYAVIFVVGIARGFSDPAMVGLEAQIVPRDRAIKASVWLASGGQTAAVLGPASAGFAY